MWIAAEIAVPAPPILPVAKVRIASLKSARMGFARNHHVKMGAGTVMSRVWIVAGNVQPARQATLAPVMRIAKAETV